MSENKFNKMRKVNPEQYGTNLTDYTPANADLPVDVKAVFFDADGTFSITSVGGGTAVTGIPCIKGMPIPFIPGRITSMTGPTHCYLVS